MFPLSLCTLRALLSCHWRCASCLIFIDAPVLHPQIKKSGSLTKFKVRCSKYLYTLCVNDSATADKLKLSLPPGMWTDF